MLLLVAGFAAAPATARATEEFPWSIRSDLALDYEPPCALCHENGMTGTGTVRTPFGMSMRLRGMIAGNDASLAKALDAMAADNVDSDHDGVSDIEELKSHTDPNRYGALPLDQANEPTYGCGGTIARSPQGAGAATGAVLLGALALGLSLRRRSSRPSRRQ